MTSIPGFLLDRCRVARAAVLLLFTFGAASALAQAAATGALTGTVNNLATGRLLDGARVEVAALGRTVLTDGDGRFLLPDLPPGEHVVSVTYEGLDAHTESFRITPGGLQTLRVDLTSGIYRLDAFKVTGEREGTAAAITAQRHAENVKNITAIDAYGIMPNLGGGELAMRLPGAAGSVDDDGTVSGIVVRGMATTLNRLTVDGGAVPPNQLASRGYQYQFVTASMFDQVELIKGHTPDKGADSLGGTVNFKTRSTLSQREKRVFTYNVGAIWAPSFTEQTDLRRDRAIAPLTTATYNEVFDALGGTRNLGVALNAMYSEKVIGYYYTIRDYQNTAATPAFLWDYRWRDDFARRFQTSLNLRFDYRHSRDAKFSVNAYSTDHFEPNRYFHDTQTSTAQTIAAIGANGLPTGTGAILPGFTDQLTQVRGVTNSTIAVRDTTTGFRLRTRGVAFTGEHTLPRWEIDYGASFHQTHVNRTSGPGAGAFTHTIRGIGWMLDRSQSDLFPRFVQTEGPDITNPANYVITGADTRTRKGISGVKNARANARYAVPVAVPVFLKTGFDVREQTSGERGGNRRWNYVGGRSLAANPDFVGTDRAKTGRQLPTWESSWYFQNDEPRDPSLWQENLYFREQSRYITNNDVSETVSAAYVMGQARVRQFGLLAGVRTERTDVESFGRVRAKTGSTAAQQATDPFGSARRDYEDTARRIKGDYTKSFPSAHLTYTPTPKLKAHLSWSTSFGRPQFSNLLPNESFNDTQRTLTINNPALKPQTARNWDATAEYYLPVGLVSVGWFHKRIADYIVTGIDGGTVGAGPDNGYNGEYEGYDILTSGNAGQAFVQGWEFSYQQQLNFLPRPFNGLGVVANFTYLRTHGDYGSVSPRGKNELAGFIPLTGNVNLTYKYRAFSTRVLVNHTGRYLTSFTASNSPRNEYKYSRTIVNFGLGWQLRPSANLFCEVMNVFNEPQARFRGWDSRMSYTSVGGTQINFGVSGRY
jgi:TonB-dependent receptor